MRTFSLENPVYQAILDHQAVHMDQGVCYCPEYLATRAMRHYPSRVAQIIRAVEKEELEASQYGADIVFSSILSGQGERWQNFGEDPNGYMLTQFLGRELFLKKGFYRQQADTLKETLDKNHGHLLAVDAHVRKLWEESIPVSKDSKTCLLLDDASYAYTYDSAPALGAFFMEKGMRFQAQTGPYFLGFEYFAAGCIEEGIACLQGLLKKLCDNGIKQIVTLCGQSKWVLTTLCSQLGITHDFEVIDILDLAGGFDATQSYIYGGSFYVRFLRQEKRLCALLPNRTEKRIRNSPEFTPLLEGDRRVNEVAIWEAPLCPEFVPFQTKTPLLDSIYQNAVCQFTQAGAKEVVVCSPHAWESLRSHGFPMQKAKYFTSTLQK